MSRTQEIVDKLERKLLVLVAADQIKDVAQAILALRQAEYFQACGASLDATLEDSNDDEG